MRTKNTKYQMIVEDIRNKILQAEYLGGHKLPGQFELAEQYKVSAITANRALNELRELGLIERRERSGSYVLDSPRLLDKIYIVLSGKYEGESEALMPYWQVITKLASDKGIKSQLIAMTDADFRKNVLDKEKSGFGVICIFVQEKGFIAELNKNNTPYVVLGIKSSRAKYNVTEDRASAAQELTLRMIEHGSRNIAFFGTHAFPNHSEAELGVKNAINDSAENVNLTIYNVGEKNIDVKIASAFSEITAPDGLIVMGGMLPFLALPNILNTTNSPQIGFMTENQSVLQLKKYAIIAYYSQEKTAAQAFKMLLDIAAKKLPGKATHLMEFKILTDCLQNKISISDA